jgi:hypothetical protein
MPEEEIGSVRKQTIAVEPSNTPMGGYNRAPERAREICRVIVDNERCRGACCNILGVRESIRWKNSNERGVVVEVAVVRGPMLKLLGRGHYQSLMISLVPLISITLGMRASMTMVTSAAGWAENSP